MFVTILVTTEVSIIQSLVYCRDPAELHRHWTHPLDQFFSAGANRDFNSGNKNHWKNKNIKENKRQKCFNPQEMRVLLVAYPTNLKILAAN